MRHIRVVLIVVCGLAISPAFSQSCDCPPAASCAPCAGGFTSLTLRFNGASASTITISDQIGQVYNEVVNPGSTFTFSGSIPNDKFAGPSVSVNVNGVLNATIGTNCGNASVGSVQGSFTVVAAVSKTGGTVCCDAGVEDSQLPVISNCPTNIVASLGASCTVAVSWTEPTVSDNCSVASFSSNKPSGSEFGEGVTPVTYTATDTYGNTATCTFNVTVSDNTLPVFANCPSDISVNASANCKAVVNWIEPVASDNCAIASTGKTNSPNDEFSVGTTTVIYTATDTNGNSATCTFTITVTDNTLPVFTNCPSDIIVPAGSNCKAAVTWIEPTVSDNCLISTSSKGHNPNDEFSIGTTLVTYTATDASGNTETCSFNVTVEDSSAPVFASCVSDIVVTAGANCKATVSWTEPTASDNCGIAGVVRSHAPGTEFNLGNTSVTYTATDIHGKVSTCSFNVSVVVTDLPQVSGCPGNLSGISDDTNEAVISWTEPVFSVRCGNVAIQKSHEPGSRFETGTTEVTYTATDDFGNTTTCKFQVMVELPKLDLEVSKLITPNGDGFNDSWKIINLERYPDNHVTIFDRWGSVLFKASGYDNESVVWRGLNKSNSIVPTGTYFYVLEVTYGRQRIKREGFIEVVQ